MMRLDYAPDLVEEAVLLAERVMAPGDRRTFRRERNRAYEVPEADRREAEFRLVHWRWFQRLALDRLVPDAVAERADLSSRLPEGRVLRAQTLRDEGADLVDRVMPADGGALPLMVVRLRPSMLLEPDVARAFLRHELMHVGDMLDPAFGYERSLAPSDDGPSADNIVRDRYRVLWDVTIDGRLSRAGLGAPGDRDARWREFAPTFSMLGDGCRRRFDDWFDSPGPTHAALAVFARSPGGMDSSAPDGRCPLCRFPVGSLDPRPERLSAGGAAIIHRDHPQWRVEQGLCSQCLDLYEARHDEAAAVSGR
jgi:hypothetical protein